MEYVLAALILNETGEEINERNLTDVLETAGATVEESRVKALVAALEDVDIDQVMSGDRQQLPDQAIAGTAGPAGNPDETSENE